MLMDTHADYYRYHPLALNAALEAKLRYGELRDRVRGGSQREVRSGR